MKDERNKKTNKTKERKIKFIVTSNEPSEEAIQDFNRAVNEVVDDILLRDPDITPKESDWCLDNVRS